MAVRGWGVRVTAAPAKAGRKPSQIGRRVLFLDKKIPQYRSCSHLKLRDGERFGESF